MFHLLRTLADPFSADTLAIFIPIVALMIPIVAVLAHHQQKMAQIIHGSGSRELHAEVEAMRREIEDLKAQVRSQAVALQQMNPSSTLAPPVADQLQDRVGF